jgi:hypothetical protein
LFAGGSCTRLAFDRKGALMACLSIHSVASFIAAAGVSGLVSLRQKPKE